MNELTKTLEAPFTDSTIWSSQREKRKHKPAYELCGGAFR